MTRKQLIEQIAAKHTFLCVGLDPDIKKMPSHIVENAATPGEAIAVFNRSIIDATAPYCVAYKPNLAFYEAYGTDGEHALAETVNI